MADLEAEIKAAELAITDLRWQQFRSLGVSLLTAANRRVRGQAAWGVMHGSAGEDGLFVPGEGLPHLASPVIMDGALIDIVAFRSNSPSEWLLRTGLGWALGLDRGFEPYLWGHPATVHETPLDWMKADCVGLCVLDWTAPELHTLKCIPELGCQTEQLKRTMVRHLHRDPLMPHIFTLPSGTERKAA